MLKMTQWNLRQDEEGKDEVEKEEEEEVGENVLPRRARLELEIYVPLWAISY